MKGCGERGVGIGALLSAVIDLGLGYIHIGPNEVAGFEGGSRRLVMFSQHRQHIPHFVAFGAYRNEKSKKELLLFDSNLRHWLTAVLTDKQPRRSAPHTFQVNPTELETRVFSNPLLGINLDVLQSGHVDATRSGHLEAWRIAVARFIRESLTTPAREQDCNIYNAMFTRVRKKGKIYKTLPPTLTVTRDNELCFGYRIDPFVDQHRMAVRTASAVSHSVNLPVTLSPTVYPGTSPILKNKILYPLFGDNDNWCETTRPKWNSTAPLLKNPVFAFLTDKKKQIKLPLSEAEKKFSNDRFLFVSARLTRVVPATFVPEQHLVIFRDPNGYWVTIRKEGLHAWQFEDRQGKTWTVASRLRNPASETELLGTWFTEYAHESLTPR